MEKKCIVGVFASDNGLRVLVNQLLEMEFEETDISVIKSEGFDYATNLGPLKGATFENLGKKLIHVGLATDLARNFKSYLKDGGALIAVSCEEYRLDEISELLGSFGAVDIQIAE